jgi:cell division inhibitor SulA
MLIVEVRGTELLWAAEQVLRSGECGVVLLWTQCISPSYKALQRLHMAAIKGNSACILYRPVDAQASP